MKVAIIGGGASGVFCALQLAKNNNVQVTLFEKNETTLKKLLITGHGRCNVTNFVDCKTFLENVPHNSKFLYAGINEFQPYDMIEYLNSLQIKTVVQENNRVFPISNKAITIKNAFDSNINGKINLCLNSKVEQLVLNNNKFDLFVNNSHQIFDCVVVATGGLSYPTTGSDGDGYKFAKNLNIKIIKPRPSLCALRVKQDIKNLEGSSVFCELFYLKDNKIKCSSKGNLIFTSFGVSGPVAFNLSSKIEEHSVCNDDLIIDFVPEISFDELRNKILNYKQNNSKRYLIHCVNEFVSLKIANYLLDYVKLNKKMQCANLSNENVNQIIQLLKRFKFNIENFDNIERATITRGGVNVTELNPQSFECKKINNLYFIGEVVDVDGFSGGFNLQIAFSSAYACAMDILKKC